MRLIILDNQNHRGVTPERLRREARRGSSAWGAVVRMGRGKPVLTVFSNPLMFLLPPSTKAVPTGNLGRTEELDKLNI